LRFIKLARDCPRGGEAASLHPSHNERQNDKQRAMEMRVQIRLFALAVPLMFCAGAQADEQHGSQNGDEKLKLHRTIDVQGNRRGAFDISFVDPSIELYVLADRTDASVDLFDSEKGRFIGRVGSLCTPQNAPDCFQGVVLVGGKADNNDISGPDGVVIVDHRRSGPAMAIAGSWSSTSRRSRSLPRFRPPVRWIPPTAR